MVIAARALGYRGGILVAVPVTEADEIPLEEVETVVRLALAEAADAGVAGAAVTPFVLEQVAAQTGGRSLWANVALLEANARVAAALSTALLQMSS